MDLGVTEKVRPLIVAVRAMVRDEILPLEEEYEAEVGRDGDRFKPTKRMIEILESLKAKARANNLWNFWLTGSDKGYGLTTVEYAYLAEEMGWSPLASEVFNCSAPDTGNMEVLERFGNTEQKARWLPDLLEGRARSAYLMTEPGVASSDATNIAMEARPEGDEWVLNGEKWWSSGAGDPRCSLYITMALTDPEASPHARHSMLLVPAATKGVEVLRALKVYGADDAPHGHMHIRFTDVRVPRDAIILGRGRGFEIAQGRLGPGRIHHCMRAIGQAERALEAMCRRAALRTAFGQKLARLGANPRHHRRSAHEHRDGAPPLPQGRLGDGYAGRARGRAAHLADQGDRAPRGARCDRPGGAAARRGRRQPGLPARQHVDPGAHAAARRRARTRCTGASSPKPR